MGLTGPILVTGRHWAPENRQAGGRDRKQQITSHAAVPQIQCDFTRGQGHTRQLDPFESGYFHHRNGENLILNMWALALGQKMYSPVLSGQGSNCCLAHLSQLQKRTNLKLLTGFAHRRCRQGERIKERDACDARGNVLSTCKTRQLMQNNDKITRKKRVKTLQKPMFFKRCIHKTL